MKNFFVRAGCIFLLTGISVGAGSLQAADLQVFYGLLHGHTFFSDGQGTPEEAFQAAKSAGLDFFAVTEHNHIEAESNDPDREDNILIANNHALYDSPTPVTIMRSFKEGGVPTTETLTVKSVKQAAADATTGTFLALYGQEFSTISTGNHVNVFEIDGVVDVPKGHFRDFYELLKTKPNSPVVQLNHPNISLDLFYMGSDSDTLHATFNDYGIDDGDYGPNFATLISETDRFVHLIEVLSGPALHAAVSPTFRYTAADDDYYFYLTQGYHVSPTAGQDNHFKTWGTITDARTGVFANSLSKDDVLDALRNSRTFATEDKNLQVSLRANDDVFMGQNTDLATDTPLIFSVTIKDGNETSAAYEVSLYGGTVHSEMRATATHVKPSDGFISKRNRTGDGFVSFEPVLATGAQQFFYAMVVQDGGDRAWTAPIWVNYPKGGGAPVVPPPTSGEIFCWTVNPSSKVYHKQGCSSVKSISPANLRCGPVPPEGRTLHACVVVSTGENH